MGFRGDYILQNKISGALENPYGVDNSYSCPPMSKLTITNHPTGYIMPTNELGCLYSTDNLFLYAFDCDRISQDLEINPSTFEGYIPIGQKMMVFYEKRANVYVKDYSDVENANIDLGSNKLKEFNFPFTLYSNSLKPNQSLNFPTLTDEDVIIQPQREILPLSFGIPLSSTLEATSISDIGNASKYDKVASTLEFMGIKMPMIIAQMIVSNSFTNLATFDLDYFFKVYVNEARSGRPYFQTTERPDYLYILEENSKIGEYTFSSKLHLKFKLP